MTAPKMDRALNPSWGSALSDPDDRAAARLLGKAFIKRVVDDK